MLTYGDGLSNVDINKLVDFHNSHKGLVTFSATKLNLDLQLLKLMKIVV